MSVTVDPTGHFTLTNVPAGDITLAFVGASADARLTIKGVTDHAQIRITVKVHGSSAELDENDDQTDGNQTEARGQRRFEELLREPDYRRDDDTGGRQPHRARGFGTTATR